MIDDDRLAADAAHVEEWGDLGSHYGDVMDYIDEVRRLREENMRLKGERKVAVNMIATIMRAVEQRRNHFRPLEIWTNGRLFAAMRSAIGPMAADAAGRAAGDDGEGGTS